MRLIIMELKKLLRILKDNNEQKLKKFTISLNSNTGKSTDEVNNEEKDKPSKINEIILKFMNKFQLINSTESSPHENVEKVSN